MKKQLLMIAFMAMFSCGMNASFSAGQLKALQRGAVINGYYWDASTNSPQLVSSKTPPPPSTQTPPGTPNPSGTISSAAQLIATYPSAQNLADIAAAAAAAAGPLAAGGNSGSAAGLAATAFMNS